MRSIAEIEGEIFNVAKLIGSHRAYLTSRGRELCVFNCDVRLQHLFLELQAAEPLERAYPRLLQLYAVVHELRGSGSVQVSDTPCRSIKEIELAMRTSIDVIEEGLEKVEILIDELKRDHARLINRMDAMGAQLEKLTASASSQNKSKNCEASVSKKLVKRVRSAAESFEKYLAGPFWELVAYDSGESLGAIRSPNRMSAVAEFRKVFPKLRFNVVEVSRRRYEHVVRRSQERARQLLP